MREDRFCHHLVRTLQYIHQLRKFLTYKTHAVHTGVEFDMYRIILDAVLAGLADNVMKHIERIYLRFEAIGKH